MKRSSADTANNVHVSPSYFSLSGGVMFNTGNSLQSSFPFYRLAVPSMISVHFPAFFFALASQNILADEYSAVQVLLFRTTPPPPFATNL